MNCAPRNILELHNRPLDNKVTTLHQPINTGREKLKIQIENVHLLCTGWPKWCDNMQAKITY